MSFGCYHHLPRATRQSYKFTRPVYKTPKVDMPGRGQSHTLVVEQEAMAPSTIGGLAGGMAHGGHIHRENYEFIGVRGPAPASTYSHGPNLRHGDLGPMAHSEHTLRTAFYGSIPEFTYIGGTSTLSRHQSWPSPPPRSSEAHGS